ncbi:uncharacterized protein PV06_00928 [Exophiala oligosperma]|uniref:Uncharacterized protein n=2 Tax=Chaetothyriales TaxID=34395 RepID=A0A0D2B7W3_9EURO|nr:uncharacterized protein PV06_00928 [Exophiala oligosperma]KAJ9633230.1 hypothetical protein H2204_007126 [Knufia peltigerae]KIW48326.1 hypothetical protein PV06_00928 [Exophiala oligosperma]
MDRGRQDCRPGAQVNISEELRSAIESLKTSTRAIERQTTLLEAQSSLADKLNLFPAAAAATTTTAESTQSKGHAWHFAQRENAQTQHVKFANEDLSQTLNTELQNESDNVAKNIRPVHAIVSETFNSDDRTLADLNDVDDVVKPSPSTTAPDIDSLRTRTAKLTAALCHFRQQALKDRLDRIYLESLDRSTNGDDSNDFSDASATEVQTDLASLYAEIDDVVTMAVSQEFGNPFDSTVKTMERLKDQAGRARITQTHDELLSMSQHLQHTATRLENLQAQRVALDTLANEYKNVGSERRSSTRSKLHRAESPTQAEPPALLSLMQHLGLSDTGLDQIDGQIEQLESKYTNQAHANMEQMLQISRDAPKSTQSALTDVSRALSSSSSTSQNQDIQTLERQISSARIQLANIAGSVS